MITKEWVQWVFTIVVCSALVVMEADIQWFKKAVIDDHLAAVNELNAKYDQFFGMIQRDRIIRAAELARQEAQRNAVVKAGLNALPLGHMSEPMLWNVKPLKSSDFDPKPGGTPPQ